MQLQLKRTVVANVIAGPAKIIDIPYEYASRILDRGSNLDYPTSTVATDHYEQTVLKKVQVIRHKIKE